MLAPTILECHRLALAFMRGEDWAARPGGSFQAAWLRLRTARW